MAPGAGEATFKADAVKGSFLTDLLHTWCTSLWIYGQAEVGSWHYATQPGNKDIDDWASILVPGELKATMPEETRTMRWWTFLHMFRTFFFKV